MSLAKHKISLRELITRITACRLVKMSKLLLFRNFQSVLLIANTIANALFLEGDHPGFRLMTDF